MLKRWNLSESENCECGEKDIIEHSLIDCPLLNHLWKNVDLSITRFLNGRTITLTNINRLFGLSCMEKRDLKLSNDEFMFINNILIVAKFAINKTRALNLISYKTCFEIEWHFREHQFLSKKENDPKN